MSKAQVIDYIEEVKKLTPIVQEQINLLEQFSKQHAVAYKALPSEYLKQQREQLALEKENERLKRETIKTTEQLEVLAKKQIQTAQANQRLQVQQAREAERLEKASERKANAVIKESSAYLQLQNRWREAQRALADLVITQGQNATATKRAQVEFEKLDTKLRSVDVAVKNYSRNVGNYKSALAGFSSLTSQLAGAFGWAGAVMAVASIAKSFYDTNKQLQTLNKSMELGAKDSEAYASNISFLKRTTEAYGTELLSTTQAYNKFYIASKNKLALEDIQLIFEKISKSASLMGLSVQTQDLVFKALEQMMSKGTVQAEELRQQLGDHLPGAFEIMSKAVGVSTAELSKMMEEGKVISSEVLPKFAIELEKAFGAEQVQRIENITSAENRMTNAWTSFVQQVDGGDGVITRVLSRTYGFITNIIKGLEILNKTASQIQGERQDLLGQKEVEYIELATDSYIKQREKRFQADKKAYTEEMRFAETKEKKEELIAYKQQQNAKRLNEIRERIRQLENKPSSTNYDELVSLKAERERVEAGYNALASLGNKVAQSAFVPVIEAVKELTKAELAELKRRQEAEARALEERLKNRAEATKIALQTEIDAQKAESLNLSQSKAQNLAIEMQYQMRLLEVVELTRQENIRRANGDRSKELLAWEKFYSDTQKIITDYGKVEIDFKKEIQKELDDSAKKALKDFTDQQKVKQKIRESEEKQLEKLKEKTLEYLRSFSDMGQFGFSSFNIFTTIEENGLTAFENLWKGADTMGKKMALTFGAVGDIVKDVYALMNQSSQARYEAELGRLQSEYDTAILFAGESTTAREAIELQFEEKKKALQRERAKREKEAAMFNAVISTAQAVVSMLATVAWPLNLVMAGLVGSLGAIQIATIASTPLPAYYTGTDNAKEGWAWTQERGAEVITDKKGNIKTMGHNEGATLTMMNAGDKVYKNHDEFFKAQEQDFNHELNDVLMSNGISPIINVENKGISKEEMLEVLSQTLEKQPKNSLNIDEKGFNLYNEKKNSRQVNKNRNVKI